MGVLLARLSGFDGRGRNKHAHRLDREGTLDPRRIDINQ